MALEIIRFYNYFESFVPVSEAVSQILFLILDDFLILNSELNVKSCESDGVFRMSF